MASQEIILHRLRKDKDRKVFIPKDFLDVASRDAADQALSRLVKAGHLQRLGRGLYFQSRTNPRLGIPIQPDMDEIAEALGRQTGSHVIPSGAVAANQLGLSTQVPAKFVYLSDGRSRRVRVGNSEIQIKHTAAKNLPAKNRMSAIVLQALRYIGQSAVDDRVIALIQKRLSPKQREDLRRDAKYATDWIFEVAGTIADKSE